LVDSKIYSGLLPHVLPCIDTVTGEASLNVNEQAI